jgi:hypothetical protein
MQISETILLLEVLDSLLELINTSACINKLLLAGEEGVALRANFNSDLASLGGLGNNGFAACASDYALFVLGLNSFFHFKIPHKIISLLVGSDFTSRVIISLFYHLVNSFFEKNEIFAVFFNSRSNRRFPKYICLYHKADQPLAFSALSEDQAVF